MVSDRRKTERAEKMRLCMVACLLRGPSVL
jgi:hypothetical protein